MSEYIHYRGETPVRFSESRLSVPPFIPYNDNSICCIIEEIISDVKCGNVKIISLGSSGKIGVPYLLLLNNNTSLVVKVSKINKLSCEYKFKPPTSLSYIEGKGINECITKVNLGSIRYLASDEFTNETLIAYSLNILTDKMKLPNLFVKHYQGAVCDINNTTYGLNIMENCDIGPVDKISTNRIFSKYINQYIVNDKNRDILVNLIDEGIILNILTQITAGLHMLQNYVGFISGDMKAGNIFLKSDILNQDYMGIKLNGPFTCKIADYGKSSCMFPLVNGTYLRFYNESILANIYLSLDPFTPEIDASKCKNNKKCDDYYYTVSNTFVEQTYSRTMHMGVPFYKSFDFYTVLVSILTLPEFYYMFFSSKMLKNIFWDSIWFNDTESHEAIKRIYQFVSEGKGRSIRDSLSILKGLKLKCSAVNIVLGKIISSQK
jgi:hypothetical protein